MNLYAEIVAYEALALLKAQTFHGVGPESVGYVARDDVGAALAGVLTGEGHNGAIYEITGLTASPGNRKLQLYPKRLASPSATSR